MDTTADHPTTLVETLTHLGLAEILTGYVPRAHITRRVSWREFVRFVEAQGYRTVTEDNNVYGKVGIRPAAPTTPALRLRVVTRSDVAATFGSRRGA